MGWVLSEIKEQSSLSPPQPQFFLYQPPPPSQPTDFNFNNKVNPSILLIIIILAIIFFISGLLHILVRFLLRPQNGDLFGLSGVEFLHKSCEIEAKDEENQKPVVDVSEEKVVLVKLGKFRNVDGGGGEGSSNNNVDSRRCFSMGSFAYVMDENSSLKVSIRTPMKKQTSKKPPLPLTPGHRPAMSECGGDSRSEFTGFEPFKSGEIHGIGNSGSISNGNAIKRSKRESFSVSKIWLRSKKEKPNPAAMESSRRAFSFRFPVHRNVELKPNNGGGSGSSRTISEINIGRRENGGESEFCCDVENQSSNMSLESQANPPSFSRRTLLWLVGKQNKVVHSSSSSTKL
ncbi:RING-H2 finger protein [Actinidia chinensis var. chinensis]|uniref:RING-H2 finger protein n=1 Tax=Actinidia chinensis var. chinensis TaxID=1590841 RepID=A0A2R6Q8V0_ACTCC|nr:RING-H2 finger protein [Actinidia chinensis var. chinensis]